jgi:hypothetical protein
MIGLGLAATNPNTMQRAAAARPYRGSLRSRGLVVDRSRIPIEDRFWSKVEIGDDCWLWTAATTHDGYGLLGRPGGRGMVTVHRLAWVIAFGPIPTGMHVLHTCDTPPCVNPAHLWLGTNADNIADKVAKGRARWRNHATHCRAGHEYTEANTRWRERGGVAPTRRCRACNREWQRAVHGKQ